jgi:glyoxylase I family protein
MEILGLVFLGTATPHRPGMTAFVEGTLGLSRVDAGTTEADMFTLPDGSGFAVSDEREEDGATSRTVGLLVADLDTAVVELRAAGVQVDDPQQNDRYRYAHFIAPDGELYELVEERAAG